MNDLSFKNFLLSEAEEKRISVDANNPTAAKREIDQASKMDSNRLARKEEKDATREQADAKNTDASDPLKSLKDKRAQQAKALAATDKMLAARSQAEQQ